MGEEHRGRILADALVEGLTAAGFDRVELLFSWFVGQAAIVNEPGVARDEALRSRPGSMRALQAALPLSRGLFKYIGFVARRA